MSDEPSKAWCKKHEYPITDNDVGLVTPTGANGMQAWAEHDFESLAQLLAHFADFNAKPPIDSRPLAVKYRD